MNTAWEDAVRRGHAVDVQDLIAQGAAIDALDRHGQTALMLAARTMTRCTDRCWGKGARS